MITTRTRRWAAIFMLAALAFAQASVAFAACSIDRGVLGAAWATPVDEGCDTCETSGQQAALASANVCIAHCTADLQQASQAVAAPKPASVLLHFVVQRLGPPPSSKGLSAPPPGAPPHRVLLHSFLI